MFAAPICRSIFIEKMYSKGSLLMEIASTMLSKALSMSSVWIPCYELHKERTSQELYSRVLATWLNFRLLLRLVQMGILQYITQSILHSIFQSLDDLDSDPNIRLLGFYCSAFAQFIQQYDSRPSQAEPGFWTFDKVQKAIQTILCQFQIQTSF